MRSATVGILMRKWAPVEGVKYSLSPRVATDRGRTQLKYRTTAIHAAALGVAVEMAAVVEDQSRKRQAAVIAAGEAVDRRFCPRIAGDGWRRQCVNRSCDRAKISCSVKRTLRIHHQAGLRERSIATAGETVEHRFRPGAAFDGRRRNLEYAAIVERATQKRGAIKISRAIGDDAGIRIGAVPGIGSEVKQYPLRLRIRRRGTGEQYYRGEY